MTKRTPRILFVDSGYFLSAEIRRACEHMGYPLCSVALDDRTKPSEFLQTVLSRIQSFRPDFVLVVNHTGVDSGGVLLSILEKMSIPLASWFVDSPELTLAGREQLAGDGVCVFCWDKGAIPYLNANGCSHVEHLPLATDPALFRPKKCSKKSNEKVLFVGNSWVSNVASLWKKIQLSDGLSSIWELAAQEIARTKIPDVRLAIEECCVDRCEAGVMADYSALSGEPKRLFDQLVIFEASRIYRGHCVAALPEGATIIGDTGWRGVLGTDLQERFNLAPSVPYGDLSQEYSAATVNFNCTSLQMHTAVNQRVFDVPVCGGFLLTDARAELQELFQADELAVYDDVDEIPDRIEYWLANAEERKAVVVKARKRILAEHTYMHRLEKIAQVMGELF